MSKANKASCVHAFCLSIFLIGLASLCAGADQYWISYSGDLEGEYERSFRYLMKIDALGRVVKAPNRVITNNRITSGDTGTALVKGAAGRILLWTPGVFPERPGGNSVYKAVIGSINSNLISIGQTGLWTVDPSQISVSQKTVSDFIVLSVLLGFPKNRRYLLVAYSTTDTSRNWVLAEGLSDWSFAVSSDGRAFVYTGSSGDVKNDLFFQPLNCAGRPAGKPEVLARSAFIMTAYDVSAQLKGVKRYVLYNDGIDRVAIRLQPVHAVTGQKIGPRVTVSARGRFPVIDPRGRFVVYRDAGAFSMYFQALDALGNPSGSRKLIATRVAGGIDILKD